MDIGKGIQTSFNVYLKNFWLLFLAGLVTMVLAGITFGILAGPLFAGLVVLCLKLLRNEKAEFNEIFAHFNKFVPTLLLVLMFAAVWVVLMIINFIPFLGVLISIVSGPALGIIFFLAIALIVEKDFDAVAAAKQALAYFLADPLMTWVYSLVLYIIAGVVVLIPSLILGGIFLLMPILLFLMPLIYLGLSGIVMPIVFNGMAVAYQEIGAKEAAPLKLEKQTLQIVGIVVGVLVVLGLVSAFCFSRFMLNPFGAFAPRVFNTPYGQVTTDNNEQVTIKTKEGTFSAGAGLPKDFPTDVAIYPNAKPEGHFAGIITFSTKDDPNNISAYYENNMAANGWSIDKSEIGDMKMLTCKKDARNVSITINPNKDKGQTDILVGIAKEQP